MLIHVEGGGYVISYSRRYSAQYEYHYIISWGTMTSTKSNNVSIGVNNMSQSSLSSGERVRKREEGMSLGSHKAEGTVPGEF